MLNIYFMGEGRECAILRCKNEAKLKVGRSKRKSKYKAIHD